MSETPKLRKALSPRDALAYQCPRCGAKEGEPCVASYDGHAIKGVHVARQFPNGLTEDQPFREVVERLFSEHQPALDYLADR